MNASEASTIRNTTSRQLRPMVEQLLDREEALAILRLADSVQNLGEDVCAMAELRPRIRRHPFLATGFAALLGVVAGPQVMRGVKRIATAGLPALRSSGPRALSGLALASLRLVHGQH
jgi:hypothetical protein